VEPVTLYAPDGRPTVVRSKVEETNLRASGYRDQRPQALVVDTAPAGKFDPAEHTVTEVEVFIAEHPELSESVIAAEKAGRNRSGIVGGS
jgi:hypothetical protein